MIFVAYNNYLSHHGIKGQHWGIRRFQNEDGSLTPEGEKRYQDSLSNIYGDDDNYDGDYSVKKGTSIFRRTSSDGNDDFSNSKYTYTYDYDNSKDDDFYKQFGKKISEYEISDDTKLAGKKTLGKAFVERMLKLDNEDDIEAMDMLYYDAKRRLGKDYVEDLFTVPFKPSEHLEALEKAGADMVSRMLATQRHDAKDEKMKKRGTRDYDTAANDIGLSIVEKLLGDGYSGMRDYNDHGSAANVDTPTIFFDPEKKLRKKGSWLDG